MSKRVEDYGPALNDEIILLVLASSVDTADLLRCAATCRRWRRLITSDAEFICRLKKLKPPDHSLAVGFFHQMHDPNNPRTPLQFLPSPSSYQNAVFDFESDLFKNSRLITSRKGRLLLQIRCDPPILVVCNTMTGRVFTLPDPWDGTEDRPEHHACALLTSDDLHSAVDPMLRPGSPAAFRILTLLL